MKRFKYGLMAIALIVFKGFAQKANTPEEVLDFRCGAITTYFEKESIEYNFRSLDALEEGINGIVGEFNFKHGKNKDCLIKIEIKLEFGIGNTSLQLSESITTDCCNEDLQGSTERLKEILALATRA